ncbi:MAG: hypothetical protein ACE5Q3_16475, partial [Alphaproteobacteria bacterium]
MTDFRARHLAVGALTIGIVGFLALGGGPVQAQAPIKLIPRKPAQVEPEVQPGTAPTADEPARTTLEPGIKVEGLTDVDVEAIGLLGPAQNGFGVGMWQGTSRELVERLVPELPARTESRIARDLMRRLLLTTATPPEGAGTGGSLIKRRVERLLAMGDVAAVDGLLRASPKRVDEPELARSSVDSLLLQFDFAGACGEIEAASRQYTTVFWQKALVFCQAVAQQHAQASLGLELLREQGADDDRVFFALIDVLAGAEPAAVAEARGEASPLNLALLRAARAPVPAWFVASSDPALLSTIAASPNADLDIRLRAAHHATRIGALPTETLATIYENLPAGDDIAPGEGGEENGPYAVARAYRAARTETVPAARAEALRRVWRLARESGDFPTIAQLSLPLMDELAPTREMAWFAGEAARALLLAEESEQAQSWFAVARGEAPFDGEAALAEAQAWPLLRIALGRPSPRPAASAETALPAATSLSRVARASEPRRVRLTRESPFPWNDANLRRWLETQRELDPGQAPRRAALLLSIFDAL